MDMLKDLYGKYAAELDFDLAQNAEYKELLERLYEIIEPNMSDGRIAEINSLFNSISGVIGEVSCIAGIKFGARLAFALIQEGKAYESN